MKENLEPAIKTKPIEVIKDELEARGWGLRDLCQASNLPDDKIWNLYYNHAPIDEMTVEGLSRAFGTSSEFWMNLQKNYDEDLQKALMEPTTKAKPRDIIYDKMEICQWRIRDLARASNLSEDVLCDLIVNNCDIEEKHAIGLSRAFGTSPEFWLNLQKEWGKHPLLIKVKENIKRDRDETDIKNGEIPITELAEEKAVKLIKSIMSYFHEEQLNEFEVSSCAMDGGGVIVRVSCPKTEGSVSVICWGDKPEYVYMPHPKDKIVPQEIYTDPYDYYATKCLHGWLFWWWDL